MDGRQGRKRRAPVLGSVDRNAGRAIEQGDLRSDDVGIRGNRDHDRLAELGLTPADVAAAVREQNAQSAAGRLGDEPTTDHIDLTLSVTTQDRLSAPSEFERIVLRTGSIGMRRFIFIVMLSAIDR